MPEENGGNGNGKRKWFPGVRIIEGIIIAAVTGLLFALAGNFILLPKLELKMELQNKTLCEAVKEIKRSVDRMTQEIVDLKIRDTIIEGDLNLLRYRAGLPTKNFNNQEGPGR